MEVVAEAGRRRRGASSAALAQRPDVAILDVSMPKLTGLQAAREIHAQAPEIDVLILSMHDDERYLFEALKAGAVAATCSRRRPTRTSSTPCARSCAASRS